MGDQMREKRTEKNREAPEELQMECGRSKGSTVATSVVEIAFSTAKRASERVGTVYLAVHVYCIQVYMGIHQPLPSTEWLRRYTGYTVVYREYKVYNCIHSPSGRLATRGIPQNVNRV